MISIHCKTRRPEALKLLNKIATYIFEQECGELQGNAQCEQALRNAIRELEKLIKQ